MISISARTVDHLGVPNSRLVEEESSIAKLYNNKSVAENNSIDVGKSFVSDLECGQQKGTPSIPHVFTGLSSFVHSPSSALKFLLQPEFKSLRSCLCKDQTEWRRFEDLIRSIVLATDIMDKGLKADRNARWDRVFGSTSAPSASISTVETDRLKATIVLEHMIQASDVAHTMQHWHIYLVRFGFCLLESGNVGWLPPTEYALSHTMFHFCVVPSLQKWNERLFHEMYRAYSEGRADKDPSEGWYQGEIGFFDYYIIPLAKKLHECEVFGVSSDEFLIYATNNRNEWEVKGREVVAGYVDRYCKKSKKAVEEVEVVGEGFNSQRMFL
jgi:hypothetical protein